MYFPLDRATRGVAAFLVEIMDCPALVVFCNIDECPQWGEGFGLCFMFK